MTDGIIRPAEDREIIADIRVVTKDGQEYDGKVAVHWPPFPLIPPGSEWIYMSRDGSKTYTAISMTEVAVLEITGPRCITADAPEAAEDDTQEEASE